MSPVRELKSTCVMMALVVVSTAVVLVGSATPASAAVPFGETPAPTWGADARVRTIVSVGGTAYFGGHFTSLTPPTGDQSAPVERNRAAAVDMVTGAPTAWDPDVNGKVWDMVAAPDGATIFLGGSFTSVGGVRRKRVAQVDTATGGVTSWKANVPSGVRALALSPDGAVLYMGGVFKKVRGVDQPYLAAVSTTTGRLIDDWRPRIAQATGPCPPRCSPEVSSLAVSADGTGLYVGGHFGSVNGELRNNAAQVSIADGSTMPWDPNVFEPDPNNPNQRNLVNGIAVSPSGSSTPDRVFICGDWWRVDGQRSPNLAAVDAVSGKKDNGWIATTDGGTPDCVVGGGYVYVGGHFQRVGGSQAKIDGVDRNHLAAIDAVTAEVAAWDPNANSVLGLHDLYLAMADDGSLFAGGDFTRIHGARQHRFAMFRRTADAPDASTTLFNGSGDASGRSWFLHDIVLDDVGTLEVTVDWTDEDANLYLFLKDPSGTTVASVRNDDKPKTIVFETSVTGTWTVAVKIKTGTTDYNGRAALS